MSYYNYHACAKRLIKEGHLTGYYYCSKHNAISPALVLMFDDMCHPVMPIRIERWYEYECLLKDMPPAKAPDNSADSGKENCF